MLDPHLSSLGPRVTQSVFLWNNALVGCKFLMEVRTKDSLEDIGSILGTEAMCSSGFWYPCILLLIIVSDLAFSLCAVGGAPPLI